MTFPFLDTHQDRNGKENTVVKSDTLTDYILLSCLFFPVPSKGIKRTKNLTVTEQKRNLRPRPRPLTVTGVNESVVVTLREWYVNETQSNLGVCCIQVFLRHECPRHLGYTGLDVPLLRVCKTCKEEDKPYRCYSSTSFILKSLVYQITVCFSKKKNYEFLPPLLFLFRASLI